VYATGPRIVLQAIRNLKLPRRLVGSIVPPGTFTIGTVHNVIIRQPKLTLNALLGILNSTLMNEYYAAHFPEHRIKGAYVDSLPILLPDACDDATDLHKSLDASVSDMLSLHERESAAAHPQQKEQLRRRIEATDRQIDQLVYQLYGLTDAEIRLVEESTRPQTV
jgi:hypothetical protein